MSTDINYLKSVTVKPDILESGKTKFERDQAGTLLNEVITTL